MESRIRRNVYVRFGGEYLETCYRNIVRRRVLSLRNKHQFASVAHISPVQFKAVADYEKKFGKTINRKCDLWQLIKTGKVYPHITEKLKTLATGYDYTQPVILPASEPWILPAGAFSDSCGPI